MNCCTEEGYCSYYKRILRGRVFQLTHGINCTQKQFDHYRKIYEDKAGLPPTLLEKTSSFISSVKEFVEDGMKTVSKEEFDERMKICDGCDQRSGNSCKICGCGLVAKLSLRISECPLKKWTKGKEK